MARSDFNYVPINHRFTATAPSFTKKFPIEGTQKPIDDAYLLVQVRGASKSTHSIRINDVALGGLGASHFGK